MSRVLRVETENIFVKEAGRATLPTGLQQSGTANSWKTGGETVMGGRRVQELLAIRRACTSQLELDAFEVCGGLVEIAIGGATKGGKHCARIECIGCVGSWLR